MPAHSMTANIGKNDRASHGWDPIGWEDNPVPAPDPASVRWPRVEENDESAELWRHAEDPPPRPPLLARVLRRLKRLVGLEAAP
jgi:hypothetical protein